MTNKDAYQAHSNAWERLGQLVVRRNKLLLRLDMMTRPAMGSALETGMVFEFDTTEARELLEEIDKLTPGVDAGIEEVNRYAERAGQMMIRWQKMTLDFGT